jgi:PKD repeat protein
MKKIILRCLPLLFFLLKTKVSAQTNLSGIINSYAKVTGIDTCQQILSVSSVTGFEPNLKILLIQMNGALMDESNSSSFGNMSSLRNVGKYEINTIDSISGFTIYLKNKVLTDYDVSAAVQIVSFPTYATATVQNTLTGSPWNGQMGGIIAFEATTLNLNADIDASGLGFLGGSAHGFNTDCVCDVSCFNPPNDYFYNASNFRGAFKGEGLAATINGKESGRGRQTIGGGGGNDHRSGGGGGGNAGNGGAGGINAEPENLRCKGNYSGIGGSSLPTTNNNNRLFNGGGGGAGHKKETLPTGSAGGNGGGIIFIVAAALNANGKNIQANGANGGSGAGGGGGGGGGTIFIQGDVVGALTLESKGGNGGASENGGINQIPARCYGPGGGGGGGKILLKTTNNTPTSVITGGIAGQNGASAASCNTGSESGSIGKTVTLTANDNIVRANEPVNRVIAFNLQPNPVASCPTRNVTMSVAAVGNDLKYQWEVGQAAGGFQPVPNNTTYSGEQSPTLRISNITAAMNQYRYRCIVTNCAGMSLTSTVGTLSVLPTASAIFSFTTVGNTVTFNNKSTQAATYIWNFGDNTTSTALNPTHTYAAQGRYEVALSAISVGNCDTHRVTQIVLLNRPPIARFGASTTDTCVQATIQFSDSSSNNTAQWYWEFPGGTPATSNQRNPIVQYFMGNSYDVTLIVSNVNGRDTMLRPQYIKVKGAPRAHFSLNRNGRNVVFTNLTAQGERDSYNWDFGDATARSAEPNPTHTYNRAGTFVVTLTATNNCGTGIYKDTIVMLALPTAQIAANQTQGCLPMVVEYNAINSLNVNNWYWQFPGGRPRTSNVANPVVQYDTVGSWPVLLTVSNSVGTYELRDSFSIRVNASPRPAFNIFKVSDNVIAIENLTTGAQSYNWNFGDNTNSNLQNPATHRYTNPGVYNVSLLAYNQSCGKGTSKQIALNFTATEDFNQEGALQISPNPTDNLLIFNFKTPKYLGQIVQFSDINGKIVKQFELNQELTQTLDISNVAAGMYFVKIGNANIVGKILKQ